MAVVPVYLDEFMCSEFGLPYGPEMVEPQKKYHQRKPDSFPVVATSQCFKDVVAKEMQKDVTEFPMCFLDADTMKNLNKNYSELGMSEKRLIYRYLEHNDKFDVQLQFVHTDEYRATFVGTADISTPPKQISKAPKQAPGAPKRPTEKNTAEPSSTAIVHIDLDVAENIAATRDKNTRDLLGALCNTCRTQSIETIRVFVLPFGHFKMCAGERLQKVIVLRKEDGHFVFIKDVRGKLYTATITIY